LTFLADFFVHPWELCFNRSTWDLARADPRLKGIEFRGSFDVDQGYQTDRMVPGSHVSNISGIENIGGIGPERFLDEVSNARIVIGIGNVS
jgi:hypothetical protein